MILVFEIVDLVIVWGIDILVIVVGGIVDGWGFVVVLMLGVVGVLVGMCFYVMVEVLFIL